MKCASKRVQFLFKLSIFFNGTSKSFGKTKNTNVVMDVDAIWMGCQKLYSFWCTRQKKICFERDSIENIVKQRHLELSAKEEIPDNESGLAADTPKSSTRKHKKSLFLNSIQLTLTIKQSSQQKSSLSTKPQWESIQEH